MSSIEPDDIERHLIVDNVRLTLVRTAALRVARELAVDGLVTKVRGFLAGTDYSYDENWRAQPTARYRTEIGIPDDATDTQERLAVIAWHEKHGALSIPEADALRELTRLADTHASTGNALLDPTVNVDYEILTPAAIASRKADIFWARTELGLPDDGPNAVADADIGSPTASVLQILIEACAAG